MSRWQLRKQRIRRAALRFTPLLGERLERRHLLAGTGSIAGLVWDDANGNGVKEAAEAVRAGVTVFLDANDNKVADAGEPSAVTAADGTYSFTSLDAGNYIVREVAPANTRVSFPQISGRRLFAVNTAASPDRIVELNPVSAAELNSFPAPVVSSTGRVGLAFDGQTLYFLSDANDTLYELNPTTGAVLDSTLLTSGNSGSLATLNGKVYVLQSATRVVSIFNPATNAVTGTLDIDDLNNFFNPFDNLGNAAGTGELVMATNDSIGFVNATTGVKFSEFEIPSTGSITSIEAVGDEIYVGYTTPFKIDVYSRSSQSFLRTLAVSFNPKGTAGWADLSGAHRVSLAAGQLVTGMHFGNQSGLASIQGTRWQDTNANGSHEAGEPPLRGRTMYVDTNDNGQRDAGEPTTTTGADGTYVFNGLPVGKHVVREEVAAGFEQTFPAVTRKRLFVSNSNAGEIVELNPQTGAVVNTLAAPFDSQIDNGLAFDGKTLYYISSDTDVLYELDPNSGSILDATPLPGHYEDLAALNGLVYIRFRSGGQIAVFNPVSNTIIDTITITGIPSAFVYDGLGEMMGPDRLLGRNLQSEVFQIDPSTGAATVMFALQTLVPYGLTSVGQEIFVGYAGGSTGQIDVYSRSGTRLRSFSGAGTPKAFALGGRQWDDGARRVTLNYGQPAMGVDFGTTEPANLPPTSISLSPSTVQENVAGAVIGDFAVSDPDVGDTHTLTVDDARFEIVGNQPKQLKLKAGQILDFEAGSSVPVVFTATDNGGLSKSQTIMVTVTNVNDSTDITLDGSGNLVITDNFTGGKSTNLAISFDGTRYTLRDTSLPTPLPFGITGIAGATGNGTSTITIPAAAITGTQIIVNANDGEDALTVDLSAGDAMTAGGILFNGGNPTAGPGDKLVITGGNQGTVTYNYTNAHDGSVVMSNYGTVTYTGLEPIVNSGSATDVIFNLPSSVNTATLGGTPVVGLFQLSGATFETTDFAAPANSVTINRGSASDTITVNALPDFSAGLTIGSAVGTFNSVTFAGAITFGVDRSLAASASGTISLPSSTSDLATSGDGGVVLTTARDIVLAAGASVTTVNGSLTLSANQQSPANGDNFSGVVLDGGTVQSLGMGNVTVRGRGGKSATGDQAGVRVLANGRILGGTGGAVVVEGIGGVADGDFNTGVSVQGANAVIGSAGAGVAVLGLGHGGGSNNRGVSVLSGGVISSGGLGHLAVNGLGGPSPGPGNQGVILKDGAIESSGGDIMIVGQGGGTDTSTSNGGVVIDNDSSILAAGSGSIRIEGIAGNAGTGSPGVNLFSGMVTTAGGDVQVIGFAGNNVGESVTITGSIQPGAGGSVVVEGDRLQINSGASIDAGDRTVTLLPTTINRGIDLGGVDSSAKLGLGDSELDRIIAGTLQIGDAESGPITVSGLGLSVPTFIHLVSGGAIEFSSGQLNTAGGNLRLAPGASADVRFATAGIDVVAQAGTLSFEQDSEIAFALNGLVADSQYERLEVVGNVNLAGVNLALSGTYSPKLGDQFTIVDNDGADAVQGTFNGLPDGAILNVNSGAVIGAFQISYASGTGNDVVLTRVNHAPRFTKGTDQVVRDEDGPQSIADWATNLMKGPADEDAQVLNFLVTNNNPGLFATPPSISPTGTLQFVPQPNARGSATVTVILQDDGGVNNSSGPQTFEIKVIKPRPWYNALRPLDVDNDGQIAPLDALHVINHLNSGLATVIPPTAPIGVPNFLDTTGNNEVAPLDALVVINALNAGLAGEGEVERGKGGDGQDDVLSLLALDAVESMAKRRRER